MLTATSGMCSKSNVAFYFFLRFTTLKPVFLFFILVSNLISFSVHIILMPLFIWNGTLSWSMEEDTNNLNRGSLNMKKTASFDISKKTWEGALLLAYLLLLSFFILPTEEHINFVTEKLWHKLVISWKKLLYCELILWDKNVQCVHM